MAKGFFWKNNVFISNVTPAKCKSRKKVNNLKIKTQRPPCAEKKTVYPFLLSFAKEQKKTHT